MNNFIGRIILIAPLLVLTSCSVNQNDYSANYKNDYIYSVGYYGYQPYRGQRDYSGYVVKSVNCYRWRNVHRNDGDLQRGWYERHW